LQEEREDRKEKREKRKLDGLSGLMILQKKRGKTGLLCISIAEISGTDANHKCRENSSPVDMHIRA